MTGIFFRNSENLPQAIQMQFSKKQKICPWIFPKILKSTTNFENFQEQHDPQCLFIFEIRDCKKRC